MLPAPGRRTLDVGCGEGRLTRDLKTRGYNVIGLDSSPTLIAAARELDPAIDLRVGDGCAIPLGDAAVDLAIAFMALHDMDAMPKVVRELARVLEPGGKLCFAIVHPINSAGKFEGQTADAPFVIPSSYLGEFRYEDSVERDGLTITFRSMHRPVEIYFRALEDAGFLVEALREPAVPEHAITSDATRRWQRLPLFLHVRARRA